MRHMEKIDYWARTKYPYLGTVLVYKLLTFCFNYLVVIIFPT